MTLKVHTLGLLLAWGTAFAQSSSAETIYTEIFGVAEVSLQEGLNYVSPPFLASNTTVAALFNRSDLPSGATEAEATVIEDWSNTTQTLGQSYWNSDADGFEGWNTNGFENADQVVLDRGRGYRITIRDGAGEQTLYFSGTLPTNVNEQVIYKNGYSLVQSGFPVPISLADAQLAEAGFTGDTFLFNSDWLLFYSPSTEAFDQMAWYDSDTSTWRNPDFTVSTREIQPVESFLVWRKNRVSDITWTNPVPYTLP